MPRTVRPYIITDVRFDDFAGRWAKRLSKVRVAGEIGSIAIDKVYIGGTLTPYIHVGDFDEQHALYENPAISRRVIVAYGELQRLEQRLAERTGQTVPEQPTAPTNAVGTTNGEQ
jgi:hypothetical protein